MHQAVGDRMRSEAEEREVKVGDLFLYNGATPADFCFDLVLEEPSIHTQRSSCLITESVRRVEIYALSRTHLLLNCEFLSRADLE